MKVCSRCRCKKFITEFRKQAEKKDGLACMCKECMKIRDVKYRQTKVYQESQDKYHKSEQAKIVRRKYVKTTTGHLRTVFAHIKAQCTNPNTHNFNRYGGRGIKCLFKSSDEFIDYIMSTLKIDPRELECDRINNDGNYEPGNIRFVTRLENARNRG